MTVAAQRCRLCLAACGEQRVNCRAVAGRVVGALAVAHEEDLLRGGRLRTSLHRFAFGRSRSLREHARAPSCEQRERACACCACSRAAARCRNSAAMLAAKKRPRADNVADGGRNQRVTRFMQYARQRAAAGRGHQRDGARTHELGQTLVAAAAAHARAGGSRAGRGPARRPARRRAAVAADGRGRRRQRRGPRRSFSPGAGDGGCGRAGGGFRRHNLII